MKLAHGVLFAVLAAASPAAAQDGLSDREVVTALERAGLAPEDSSDDTGQSWTATVRTPNGAEVTAFVRPYDCSDATGLCRAFTIFANFSTPGGVPDELKEAVNTYNDTHVRGRAYALSEQLGVDYLMIADGSARTEYLVRRLGEYGTVLDDFLAVMREALPEE